MKAIRSDKDQQQKPGNYKEFRYKEHDADGSSHHHSNVYIELRGGGRSRDEDRRSKRWPTSRKS